MSVRINANRIKHSAQLIERPVHNVSARRGRILAAAMLCAVMLQAADAHAMYTDTDRAKDLFIAQRFNESARILQKTLEADPQNAEARFHLALCHLRMRSYFKAETHFRKAVHLRPMYSFEAGGELKRAGSELLMQGLQRKAGRLFVQAAGYQPGLKSDIATDYVNAGRNSLHTGRLREARELFQAAVTYLPAAGRSISEYCYALGIRLLQQGDPDRADEVFEIAIIHEPARKQMICAVYHDYGDNANDGDCLDLYRRVLQYCSRHNTQIAGRLLAISSRQESETEMQRYRREAAAFGTLPPDRKIYSPGTYHFALQAQTKNDHWIQLAPGTQGAVLFSADNAFSILFDDGTMLQKNDTVHGPDNTYRYVLSPFSRLTFRFKITADTYQPHITMIVR